MSQPISEEQLKLRKRARRRLIGAIALVSLVAVFLPMILDSEPKPLSQDVNIQIPSPNAAGEFTSKVVPMAPAAKSATPDGKPAAAPPAPKASITAGSEGVGPADRKGPDARPPEGRDDPAKAAESKPAPVPEKAAAKPTPKPASKPVAEAKPAAPTGDGGFVIQIAALADTEKVEAIKSGLAAKGVKAYTESVSTAKGKVTRVRVGPFPTREAAEKRRDQLAEMGYTGNVVAR